MYPFIGQILMFGGNFAPRGWAFCNGQLLPISSHSALFSILGTTYGGDGRTTFGLPNFRGRVPVHPGQAPGTSDNIRLGQSGGNDRHTLTVAELAAHNHDGSSLTGKVACNEDDGDNNEPSGRNIGIAESGTPYNSVANDATVGGISVTGSTGNQGGNQAFSTRNPYQGINYIIALEGTYPSRS